MKGLSGEFTSDVSKLPTRAMSTLGACMPSAARNADRENLAWDSGGVVAWVNKQLVSALAGEIVDGMEGLVSGQVSG